MVINITSFLSWNHVFTMITSLKGESSPAIIEGGDLWAEDGEKQTCKFRTPATLCHHRSALIVKLPEVTSLSVSQDLDSFITVKTSAS